MPLDTITTSDALPTIPPDELDHLRWLAESKLTIAIVDKPVLLTLLAAYRRERERVVAEHIDRARTKLAYADDCRIGDTYHRLISEAAGHLRAAGLHELADRCDAIVADGFGGGGELVRIDAALSTMETVDV